MPRTLRFRLQKNSSAGRRVRTKSMNHQRFILSMLYSTAANRRTAVPNTPITMPKIARPIPCRSSCLRISRTAIMPHASANGAGKVNTEIKPRYPAAIAQADRLIGISIRIPAVSSACSCCTEIVIVLLQFAHGPVCPMYWSATLVMTLQCGHVLSRGIGEFRKGLGGVIEGDCQYQSWSVGFHYFQVQPDCTRLLRNVRQRHPSGEYIVDRPSQYSKGQVSGSGAVVLRSENGHEKPRHTNGYAHGFMYSIQGGRGWSERSEGNPGDSSDVSLHSPPNEQSSMNAPHTNPAASRLGLRSVTLVA